MRNETRYQRYVKKSNDARKFPLSVATVNFRDETNVGLVIRAAACFGAMTVHVVGSLPASHDLKRVSCGTNHHVTILTYKRPQDLIDYVRANDIDAYSAELVDDADSILDIKFDLQRSTMLIVGHETEGIPADILYATKPMYIPMPGPGYCLNTSQAANIVLYEYVRQALM